MMGLDTTHLLVLINGYDGSPDKLQSAVDLTIRLLRDYAEAQNVDHVIYS